MYRKIGREIGNIAENKVNLHGLVVWMSDIIFSHASSIKSKGFNNGYQQKVLLKLKLMDGLSKKNNCIGWKVGMRAEGERTGYTERKMRSDSGLSRRCACPEKCEATAIRWRSRTGCQSRKVALIPWKAKESACQPCSAVLKEEKNMA